MRADLGDAAPFRAVNERIVALSAHALGTVDFVCECGDTACTRAMRMTLDEYRSMAAARGAHAVLPGHEQLDLEHPVGRTDRYVIVRGPEARSEDAMPA